MAYEDRVAAFSDTALRCTIALALVAMVGCDDAARSESQPTPPPPAALANDEAADPQDSPEPMPDVPAAAPDTGSALPIDGEVEDAPPPAPANASPIEIRQARRAMMTYAAPDFDAGFRGKIPHGEHFEVFAHVEGDADCRKDGWGRVGPSAFACLERTVVSDSKPRALPRVPGSRLVPFLYARRRKTGEAPGRWKSRAALLRGDDPVDTLDLDHDYAFVGRRRRRSGAILTDRNFRAVKEAEVRKLKPSEFAGRNLSTDPIQSGKTLGWIVQWPNGPGLERPREEAPVIRKLPFQSYVYVDPEPTKVRGRLFHRIVETDPQAPETWLSAKHVRFLIPADAPEGITDTQLWIDVELTQQTLRVMRGNNAEFVTLVSSGTHRHPTPTGLYRLSSKHGFADMRSRADEDEPYHVEAVPWIQYFKGRYAFHAAFWHNRFGHRVSHGCINLAPKDAAMLFDVTTPPLPGGWISVYEHADDEGTLLRIRKGALPVEDRRRTPRTHRPDR